MLGRIIPMANKKDQRRIAVVYSSKGAGDYFYDMLCGRGLCQRTRKPPITWQVGCLVFTSVEGLNMLERENARTQFSMIVLLDPDCMVHQARNLRLGNGRTHDRPQIIVNALCDSATDGLQPLFVVMTCKPSISIATEKLARIYCRETWWFCDGPSLAVSDT